MLSRFVSLRLLHIAYFASAPIKVMAFYVISSFMTRILLFDAFLMQCMCSGCAKVLRFQTNRCPICRQPVERLLEIKVNSETVEASTDESLP